MIAHIPFIVASYDTPKGRRWLYSNPHATGAMGAIKSTSTWNAVQHAVGVVAAVVVVVVVAVVVVVVVALGTD